MGSFDLYFHESLDSTSTEAKKLLELGTKTPFVILASEQKGGRGRTGRTWSSPHGNLYLTIAMNRTQIPDCDVPRIPLKVAYILALWIRSKFDLRVTIKWPNDILFGGLKLAGILCESQFDAKGWGPVLVGIGLNVSVAPSVDQETTSLNDHGKPFHGDLQELGRELTSFVLNHIQKEFQISFLDEYGIQTGQVWTNGEDLHKQVQISDDGQLYLSSCVGDKLTQLNHTHHEMKWIYQDSSAPIFIADAGNTSLKLACIRKSLPTEVIYVDYKEGTQASDKAKLQKLIPQSFWPIHAGIVADNKKSEVRKICESLGLTYTELMKRSLKVSFSQYNFDEIGIDRVAICEAMASKQSRDSGKIAVSLGTAVTVDVVGRDHKYLGGWILPGLQTGLNALHEKTAKLPYISISALESGGDLPVLGYNTETSLSLGAIWSLVLAVKKLHELMRSQYSSMEWNLFVTGGEGHIVAPLLEGKLDESLIVEGLALLAKG